MKMVKCVALMALAGGMGLAQQAAAQTSENGKGKMIVTTFANMYSNFGAENDERGFELERAYLGYEYKFNNGLEIRAVGDFGRSKEVQDMQRLGFIKHAWVGYKKNGWSVFGGLITTTQFKLQEDFWGKRYVRKSLQDEYKFGSSADVGISVAYQFCDQVSADVIVVNGEGYKKIQVKDGLLYGAGVTVKPFEGMTLRAYASVNESGDNDTKNKINLASFAGYQKNGYAVAAEYNYQMHTDYLEGLHRNGISVYGTMPAGKMVNVFARWDKMNSNNAWNLEEDEQVAMVGAEVKLGKQVKLTPNFRLSVPDDRNLENGYEFVISTSFKL